jgi:hypothetical protein
MKSLGPVGAQTRTRTSAEPPEPARPAGCRNFRRCSRAVHRMDCSQRECLSQPRPLRRRLPSRADSLLGLIHAAPGLIGGDQLARLCVTLHV